MAGIMQWLFTMQDKEHPGMQANLRMFRLASSVWQSHHRALIDSADQEQSCVMVYTYSGLPEVYWPCFVWKTRLYVVHAHIDLALSRFHQML